VSARRSGGWRVTPPFGDAGPGSVDIALDEFGLTQWSGEPALVWQTPLSELHELEVRVGRTLTLRARVGPVRYSWSQTRRPEHDELIETVRSLGGHVERARRGVPVMALSVALVMVAASLAAIATSFTTSSVDVTHVANAANVTSNDLPVGWYGAPSSLLATLNGAPGSVVTSSTQAPKLTGVWKGIWSTLTNDYQRCRGVSAATDRLYGKAGVQPAYQVTGKVYASMAFGGSEIGSVSQYYTSNQSVTNDVAQYSDPRFGRCFAATQAQQLVAFVGQSAAGASKPVASTNYVPITLPGAWRSGGVAAVHLPSGFGNFHLVAVLIAAGHEEVTVTALVKQWPAAEPVVQAAVAAVIARIGHGAKVVTA